MLHALVWVRFECFPRCSYVGIKALSLGTDVMEELGKRSILLRLHGKAS